MSVPRRRHLRTYLPADQRRAQILDVAKQVFTQRGYRVANVADICAAARIARGTLYQYFENKRAVLLAVMEDLEARIRRVVAARPEITRTPNLRHTPDDVIVEFCERRLRELLEAVFADRETLRLILRDARGLDGGVDEVIGRIDEVLLAALVGDLEAARAAGVLRPCDTRLTARFLLGGVEKMVLTALVSDEEVDLDAIVSTAVDLELFGLLDPRRSLGFPSSASEPRAAGSKPPKSEGAKTMPHPPTAPLPRSRRGR